MTMSSFRNNVLLPSFHMDGGRHSQRGAVMALVLIVLVIMMIGSIALLRSVDTSALLSGNLAFKRDTTNRTGVAMNLAFKQFLSADFVSYSDSSAGCQALPATACTYASNWKAMNYWPRLLESDANGVPVLLKNTSTFDGIFPAKNILVQDGVTLRFVIERMCSDYGVVDKFKCLVANQPLSSADGRDSDQFSPPVLPLYRVTIRSDGPRNAQTYVQAIVTTNNK